MRQFKTRKLQYLGHLIRHNSTQLQLIEGKIEGRRSRGRPRNTWTTDITSTKGHKYYQLKRAAEDRKRWHFRGSTIQKSGKCHGLPRKSILFFNPHPTLWLGVLGLKISKNLKKFHQLQRKWFNVKPLTPTHPGEAVLGDTGRGGRRKVGVRKLEGRKLSGGRKGGGREGM